MNPYGMTMTRVHSETNPDRVVTIGNNHYIDPDKVTMDIDGGPVALVDREELLTAIAGKQPGEEPAPEKGKAERLPGGTAERIVVSGTGVGYEISDRILRGKTLWARAGGLGDNIVLEDLEAGFEFTLGLATIEAIAKEHNLLPREELKILTEEEAKAEEESEWLKAEVIRADLYGERVFAVRDWSDDWLILGGKSDGDYVYSDEFPEDEFSNVEIVKA